MQSIAQSFSMLYLLKTIFVLVYEAYIHGIQPTKDNFFFFKLIEAFCF